MRCFNSDARSRETCSSVALASLRRTSNFPPNHASISRTHAMLTRVERCIGAPLGAPLGTLRATPGATAGGVATVRNGKETVTTVRSSRRAMASRPASSNSASRRSRRYPDHAPPRSPGRRTRDRHRSLPAPARRRRRAPPPRISPPVRLGATAYLTLFSTSVCTTNGGTSASHSSGGTSVV